MIGASTGIALQSESAVNAQQLCDAMPDQQPLSLRRAVEAWLINARYQDRSLGCFKKSDSIRIAARSLIHARGFIITVNLVILCCVLLMTINCPLWFPLKSTGWWVFWWLDLGFSIFFTFELAVRVISNGLLFGKSAELQTGWGRLDTVIVAASWLALLEAVPNINGARALRTLRALKTLRTLRSGRWFGTTLSALEIAMTGLRDVTMAGTFFLVLYSLMGLSFFSGALNQRCVEHGTLKPMVPPVWCGSDLYGNTLNSTSSDSR